MGPPGDPQGDPPEAPQGDPPAEPPQAGPPEAPQGGPPVGHRAEADCLPRLRQPARRRQQAVGIAVELRLGH